MAAAAALCVAPDGFTVAAFAAKVRALTGQSDNAYTTRQAAYDVRKLRAHQLLLKPLHSRHYIVPPDAARTMVAVTALRDHVVAPILAGVHSPRQGPRPATWTAVDRNYETLRIDMQHLFATRNIATAA